MVAARNARGFWPFSTFRRVIGCGLLSGLHVRHFQKPLAGMVICRSGPNLNNERIGSLAPAGFPDSDLSYRCAHSGRRLAPSCSPGRSPRALYPSGSRRRPYRMLTEHSRLSRQHMRQPRSRGDRSATSQFKRDMAPMMRNWRISACPSFETRPRRFLPPEECCRGTRPSQAAKSRHQMPLSSLSMQTCCVCFL